MYHNRNEQGGGFGAYIEKNITLKKRKDYYYIDTIIEQIWIAISDKNNIPLLIGTL